MAVNYMKFQFPQTLKGYIFDFAKLYHRYRVESEKLRSVRYQIISTLTDYKRTQKIKLSITDCPGDVLPPMSIKQIKEARDILSQMHPIDVNSINDLYYLAKDLKETGKTDSAIKTLKETITLIESMKNKVAGGDEAKKIFTSGNKIVLVYSEIVELLMQQGRVDEAMEYLERGNSESLKSKFKNLNVTFNDQKKNDALNKEKELKSKVELANDQIIKEKSKPQTEQNKELIKKLEEIKTIHQSEYISFVNQVVTQEPSLKNYFSKSENPINPPADLWVMNVRIAAHPASAMIGYKRR